MILVTNGLWFLGNHTIILEISQQLLRLLLVTKSIKELISTRSSVAILTHLF